MTIDSIKSSAKVSTLQTKALEQNSTKQVAAKATDNKDILVLSEKAKELIAKQSGNIAQEEQNESQATKMKENE